MEISNIEIFGITEESVSQGDKIASITIDTPVDFEIDSPTPSWLNLSIASSYEANIYLTGDAIDPINADNPTHPEEEVQKIIFSITYTDRNTGESRRKDFEVPVTRINDSLPVITGKYIEPVFSENLFDDMRIAHITTALDASFMVIGDHSDLFGAYQNIPNQVDILLNHNGVNYINNFDWTQDTYQLGADLAKDIDFDVLITDRENGKVLQESITLVVRKGNKEIRIPTKSNLEIFGEYVGEEIAKYSSNSDNEIEANKVDINYLKDSFDALLEEVLDSRESIEKVKKDTEEIFERLLQGDKFIDDKFTQSLEAITEVFLNETLNNFRKHEEGIQNNTEAYMAKDASFQGVGGYYQKSFEFTMRAVTYLWDWVLYWTRARGGFTSDLISNKIDDYAKWLEEEIFSRIQIILNQFYWDIKKLTDITVVAINNTYRLDKRVKVLNGRIGEDRNRMSDIEDDIDDINSRNLQDWGDSNDWAFVGNNLKYKNNKVLLTYHSGAVQFTSPVNKYVYLSSTNTRLKMYDSKAYFQYYNGSSWSTNDTDVYAEVFHGTATAAEYSDLAEWYTSDSDYPYGTVLSIATEGISEVTLFNKEAPLAGIVSKDPGFILASGLSEIEKLEQGTAVPVALKGKVDVLVSSNSQFIKKGYWIYADPDNPGYCIGFPKKNPNQDLELLGYSISEMVKLNNKNYVKIKV